MQRVGYDDVDDQTRWMSVSGNESIVSSISSIE